MAKKHMSEHQEITEEEARKIRLVRPFYGKRQSLAEVSAAHPAITATEISVLVEHINQIAHDNLGLDNREAIFDEQFKRHLAAYWRGEEIA